MSRCSSERTLLRWVACRARGRETLGVYLLRTGTVPLLSLGPTHYLSSFCVDECRRPGASEQNFVLFNFCSRIMQLLEFFDFEPKTLFSVPWLGRASKMARVEIGRNMDHRMRAYELCDLFSRKVC